MATLTGRAPKDTYKDLLQVSNSNSGVDATIRTVEDGEGTSSALQLSTGTVRVNGALDGASGATFDWGAKSFKVDTISESTSTAGVTIDSVLLKDNTVLAGTLTIGAGSITDSSGAISFGDEDLTTTGSLTIASMGGNWTNAGRTVADMGIVTTVDINGGTIDGSVIGGASAAAGTFTTINGTTGTFSGLLTCSEITLTATNPEILGGDSDGVMYISSSTASTLGANIVLVGDTHATLANDIQFRSGASAQLSYDDSASSWNFQANAISTTGAATLSGGGALTGTWSDLGTVTTVDINGGTIDGSVIGGSSAAAGTFTTISGTTGTLSGVLSVDDLTDSTSAITGSIHTDGGLGVAKNLVVGGVIDIQSSSDISPNTAGDGHISIAGNGYVGYIALDATAMHLGQNSDVRDLIFQTNETTRVTIDGSTGDVTFAADASLSTVSGAGVATAAETDAGTLTDHVVTPAGVEETRKRLRGVTTFTTSRAGLATDAGQLLQSTSASAVNYTINTAVFTAGDVVLIQQKGAGQVTIVAGASTTVNNANGLKSAAQHSVISVVAVSSTEFIVFGDTTA